MTVVPGTLTGRPASSAAMRPTLRFSSPARGYDHDLYRDRVRRFEITPHIARRGIEHGSRLGVYRWGVEGTTALLQWVSPLADPRRHHHAFVTLGCALICW
ncbi:hypothetical protein ACFXPN_24965 [Streptomyces griseorubiginosus]|uniref:hypothetical protein n=1 Tax=Streptomyces griseorubiginosus TaxID=67304 RepID=UPI00367AB13B